jgi:hypothetical protein
MDPQVRDVSQAIPAFQAQRIMDMSLLWRKSISAQNLEAHMQAFQNINAVLHLKIGEMMQNPVLGEMALAVQAVWLVVVYVFCLILLKAREREP